MRITVHNHLTRDSHRIGKYPGGGPRRPQSARTKRRATARITHDCGGDCGCADCQGDRMPLKLRDSSEAMQGFIQRQAARKAKADVGIVEAEKLAARLKAVRQDIKRKTKAAGGYLVAGPQSYQLSDADARVSSARAGFGLAINNISSAYPGGDYDKWMANGADALKLAEDRVSSLETLMSQFKL
jgi:hypothetical protein